jgi:hypothetical protein
MVGRHSKSRCSALLTVTPCRLGIDCDRRAIRGWKHGQASFPQHRIQTADRPGIHAGETLHGRETKVYTPQEAKLRIAEAKLNWQPGYNDAIAGRPWEQTSDGLIEVDYDQGYLEGEEKRQSCTERLGSLGIVGVR